MLTPEAFVAGYLAFLEENMDVPWFRYEDFLVAPDDVLAGLCKVLDVEYMPKWRDELNDVPALTGHPNAKRAALIQAPAAKNG